MKKKAAVTGFIAISLATFSVAIASAQQLNAVSGVDGSAGGLGTGLNYMVKNILNDQSVAPSGAPAAETMMMSAEAAVDARIAPQTTLMAQPDMPQGINTRIAPVASPAAFKASDVSDIAQEPLSKEGLRAYISELLLADGNIQSIDAAETHVRVTYAVPRKVFRFVPVVMRVTAGAYASGETQVTHPWYAFSSSKASKEFKVAVRERVEPMIPEGEFSPDVQKMLIGELYGVLAEMFGSTVGDDR